ncbi:MAG: NAD(P)-dependent oxidoreductase [Cytophagales bacterium]|nr:NAD(P)-dependent oxidoreductase [Cytophagales bacterium]
MQKIRFGILKETRQPPDARVAFSPIQCKELQTRFPVEISVQPSEYRIFSDKDYKAQRIPLVENLSGCDVLFGVKEVRKEVLIPEKTYFFFSHTIKKQPNNRELLRTVLDKGIRLIDYECLTDIQGNRLVAFGRFAGVIGAYNGLMMYGLKHKLFQLERAYKLISVYVIWEQCEKLKLPPMKIAVTGSGRVALGAEETLQACRIPRVSPKDFLEKSYSGPVYTVLGSGDYHVHKDGKPFDRQEFHSNPERYGSDFLKFAQVTDLLLACAYWNPKAPLLFQQEDMLRPDFHLKAIADVTCDIQGSIPSTIESSTILNPFYDYEPLTGDIHPPFTSASAITVMAVDNLPCELHRDASIDFGRQLIDKIIPDLFSGDKNEILQRATIAKNGMLMPRYQYLTDYIKA